MQRGTRTGLTITDFAAGPGIIAFTTGIFAVTGRPNAVIRRFAGFGHVGVTFTSFGIRAVQGAEIVAMRPGRTGMFVISGFNTYILRIFKIGIFTASRRFIGAETPTPGTCPRIGNETD